MTACTELENLEIQIPFMEVVRLTASDGYTYESKKFGTITGALVCGNYDADADINVSFSGSTATLNWASQSSKTCTLVLFGSIGN